MNTPEEIVDLVISFFEKRKGFDWWWDDIDEDIQLEIRHDLIDEIAKASR